jgi:CheY-like chemotaxis protein
MVVCVMSTTLASVNLYLNKKPYSFHGLHWEGAMLLNEEIVLTLMFVVVAVAIAVAVALAIYRRRCRQTGMRAMMGHPEKDFSATPRGKRLIGEIDANHETLDWEDNEASGGSDDPHNEFDRQQAAVVGRRKTILAADDDPVILSILTRRLLRMGFQVIRSPDAAHALLGAAKMLPDLLILDINMPSGNGLAVCEMMACDRRCAHIPVIVHSVLNDEAVKRRCERLGAHFVEKSPRSWNEIKSLVESLIGERKDTPSQPEDAMQPSDASADSSTGKKTSTAPASDLATAATMLSQNAATAGRRFVLCFESPQGRLEAVENQLLAIGIQVSRWTDFEEGFWTSFMEKPFAMIVQIADNKKGLLALLARIAQHPVTRAIPVLVVNENDAIDPSDLPSGGKIKILKHPADWEDLLCELEAYFPALQQDELTSPVSGVRSQAPANREDSHPLTASGQPAATDASSEALTFLCIDDDPVVAKSIANRLQPYPIKLKWANNGTQGYMMAITEKLDLILLDLKMPNGEGNYVLAKLKENPQTKGIPVIVLTVEANKGVRRQMFAMGADAYLNKPIQWPELFAEMGRCVRLPKQLLRDYKIDDQLALAEL